MIFNGEFAVFSHNVPDVYLSDFVALGGQIVRTREEIAEAVFFFAHSEWDRDFIAMFFRSDYRVLDKHYIFDCASNETRLPEQNYGYAENYMRGVKRRREEEDFVGQEEEAEVISARTKKQWGMLTPAASLVNPPTRE
ncbi:hypothetical protein B0H19DRAFT_1242510 [Mycena capillaripes]|nr:hypothetical protein B0H19DRAFT_1242510 [Mycena capillaripes]